MKRKFMASLTPPLAICHYGCAGRCVAPVSVFWITGIISIIYGFMGGPANLQQISWMTVLLGFGLWIISAVWAENALRGIEADQQDPECKGKRANSICRIIRPQLDESDPLEEIKKFQ